MSMRKALCASIVFCCAVCATFAQPDPNFHIYLLFGQSNMAGGCNGWTATQESIDRQPADCDTTSRVKLLAYTDCSYDANNNDYNQTQVCESVRIPRLRDRWYTAVSPYHNCYEGMGPAEYFGKTLLDSISDDISMGFIPCALSGQSITVFKKGQMSQIPGWCNPYLNQQGNVSVYDWMRRRCEIAQQSGVIKGVLFHQGESDAGNPSGWLTDVKTIFDDLKQDLNLDDSIPFIVGELLYTEAGGNCGSLNPTVNRLASQYPRCGLASAQGLDMRLGDSGFHFDCASVRELGRRYAKAFLSLADDDWIPRKVSVSTRQTRYPSRQKMLSSGEGTVTIYTIDGRAIKSIPANNISQATQGLRSNGVYIISRRLSDGTNSVGRFFKNGQDKNN